MLSAPTSTAPAASSRSIRAASRLAGGASRLILDPASVDKPATSNRFFTANGTPASGPKTSPRAHARSRACARSRARRSVMAVKALRAALSLRMRMIAASTTLAALARPDATAAAMSVAALHVKSGVTASCMKDGPGFGIVGKRKFVDQSREPQDETEIEYDA